MNRLWLAIALLLGAAPVLGQAQTLTLVRSCPTQPASSGFSACTNSQWSVPSTLLIVDVLRNGIATDVWIQPSQLIAGDRVFACSDPTITAGPFKTCPTPLTGQTSNWLDPAKVNFSPIPPAAAGSIDWMWQAPTLNADGTPLSDLAGYHLYVRPQSVPTYGTPIVITTPATLDHLMTNLIGVQCAEIAAFNAAGADGILSDERCSAPSLPRSVPAKMILSIKGQ
jgi:hypothetical protein